MASRYVCRSLSISSIQSSLGGLHQNPNFVEPELDERLVIKASRKRWLVLFLFTLNTALKAFQWIQLPATTLKLTHYYGVENYVINATSVLFPITYMLLTYPACFIIEAVGIRRAVLFGSSASTLACLVRCFSCNQDYGIYLLFLSQVIVAVGENLLFSVPSRLASIWFPDHQVSTAVGLTIFGNQLAIALGFLLPQYLLNEANSAPQLEAAFFRLFVYVFLLSALTTLSCAVFFDEAPRNVPGKARRAQLEQELQERAGKGEARRSLREDSLAVLRQMREIIAGRNFALLAASFGINIGTSNTLLTLLNQTLEVGWPGDDIFVGLVGFIVIISGVLGSLFWGPLLDRNHKYLATNIAMTVAGLVSVCLLAYAVCLLGSQTAVYLAAALYGLFQTGFYVAGLDLAVELTYPTPELVSASLMNVCPNICGMFAVFLGSFLVDNLGPLALFSFCAAANLVALSCLVNVKELLNRQTAVRVQQQLQLEQAAPAL